MHDSYEETLRGLRAAFPAKASALADEIEAALSGAQAGPEARADAARHAAHKLKGSAAMLRFPGVQDAAGRVEAAVADAGRAGRDLAPEENEAALLALESLKRRVAEMSGDEEKDGR